MNTPLKLNVEELTNRYGELPERDQDFAKSLCDQYWNKGLSHKQAYWVGKLLERIENPEPPREDSVDFSRVYAVMEHAGSKLNGYLSGSGCRVEHLRATYQGRYTPEQLEVYVERNNRLFDEVLAQQYYDHGWTTPDEMAESVEEWRRFAREPGSIYMSAWVEAVGIKL